MNRPADSAKGADRAVELDPLSPAVHRATGMAHYLARRFDRAAAAERRALDLDPGSSATSLMLAWIHLAAGSPERALAVLQPLAPSASDVELRLAGLAVAHSRRRDPAAAATRAVLLARPSVAADALVRLHAGTGDTEAALAALERAIAERLDIAAGVNVDPLFDGLRADMRFKALVARVGL